MHIEPLNPKVYWDVSIAQKPVGRVVLELFQDKAPTACANFTKLLPQYKNTYFHRIIKNFMIQGGDIVYGQANQYNDSEVGSGAHPDGIVFENENEDSDDLLTCNFLLCMANSGTPNSNGAQFFVTLAPSPHLHGKHSVFGCVVEGKAVLREVERVRTTPENVPVESELPVITGCGLWQEGDDVPIYNASYSQLGGDVYEEYPDDDNTIIKHSDDSSEVTRSVYKAALAIKESGGLLYKAGSFQESFFKYRKCMRYIMEYIPDADQEPENYKQYVELKKKVYMNLSLVCLKLQDFQKCVDYCTYLLDMELSAAEKAKTLYRLGTCMVHDKKYKEAITIFTTAREFSDDPAIAKDLAKAETSLQKEKDKEKAKYAKFFA